jgi:endonuclease/exonuclease/phosphatase family metal-dependent hydrolase
MTGRVRLTTAIAVTGALLCAASVQATAVTAPAAATTPPPAQQAIRVATYNVGKADLGTGRFTWANRRLALVRAVAAAAPDVLLVQEASTQLWGRTKHIDDVRRLLRSVGYQIASDDYTGCTPGCTRGAHVFFDPRDLRVTQMPNPEVAVGMTGLSVIAGRWNSAIQDRAVSWAFLTPVGSTRSTLYVSVHLPTPKTSVGEALRVAVAERLRPWAEGLIRSSGLTSAEIVIGGDFNSFDRRQPNGAQKVLRTQGLIDGYSAPKRVRAKFGTVNYTPKTRIYRGFPPRPWFYRSIAPCRIDYIFSTVAPLRYEVFLKLRSDRAFMNSYRASDHNMVLVDLPLR